MEYLTKRESRALQETLEKDIAIGEIVTEIFEKDILPLVKDLNPRSLTLNKITDRGQVIITLDVTRIEKKAGLN